MKPFILSTGSTAKRRHEEHEGHEVRKRKFVFLRVLRGLRVFFLAVPVSAWVLFTSVIAQDASAVLDAAAKAMGTASLQSIQYSGSGNTYFFGQAVDAKSGWPRMILKNYVADVNYTTPAM